MNKLIAILVASMFASGSVFAAAHMKGEAKKKDEKKTEVKKDDKKAATRKDEKKEEKK